MGFLTPTFLVGLTGMLIPVLIHLLTRDRVRRVEFSTLRFFVKTSGRVLRRKRFREMILLLLRAVACGLLAVAFARPLLEDDEPDEGLEVVRARTARVILADVSASMRRGKAAEAMSSAARQALADLSEHTDAAAVIAFAENVTIEAPLATKFDRAAEAVDSLTPGHGATNIPQALRRANDQLKRARAQSSEIVLISDLQRTGWQHLKEDFKLSRGVMLLVRPVPVEPRAGRIAIRGGNFPETTALDRESQDISVQLVNYSLGPAEGVEVRFVLGGRTQTRKVNLRANGTATATFRHVFETPGDNPGRVEVAGAGVFHFNTRVIPKIKVVLIDGGMQQGRASDAAFYLETAMAPGADVSSPFVCRTLGASRVTPADLADAQVAILANVHSVSAAARAALAKLLHQGGGLLLMPGDRAEPGAFAANFGELSPCKLREVRTGRMLRTGGTAAALGSIDFQHP
ncbi:MAG: BatA and WFA domain-containing protein, partial [Phycisphaerae bacterium]